MTVSDAFPAFGMAAFAISYGLIAISPGPNLLVVAQAGLTGSRRQALCTASGVAAGASLLTILSYVLLAGLDARPWLRVIITLVFATLLLLIGCRVLLCALKATSTGLKRMTARKTQFWAGFLTALLNPGTMAFMCASLSGQTPDGAVAAMRAVIVFVIAGVWFSLAGSFIALPFAQGFYHRYSRYLLAASGAVFIGLSLSAFTTAIDF